jgi:hypothetical protein
VMANRYDPGSAKALERCEPDELVHLSGKPSREYHQGLRPNGSRTEAGYTTASTVSAATFELPLQTGSGPYTSFYSRSAKTP